MNFRAVGAAVARPPHTRKVTGSNPVLPIFNKNTSSGVFLLLSHRFLLYYFYERNYF